MTSFRIYIQGVSKLDKLWDWIHNIFKTLIVREEMGCDGFISVQQGCM